jgi:TM2 domain-containing membrane protein YozV
MHLPRTHGRTAIGKHPEIAILLSWLVPGAGEVYLGRRCQGAALIVAFLTLAIPIWANLLPYLILVWPTLVVWVIGQVRVWRAAGVRPSDYTRLRRGGPA